MSLNDLFLRKGADRRLRAGHLWVYSNEVDTGRSPLAGAEPGTGVRVRASNGDVLGSAYLDPRELICARVYAPGKDQPLDSSLCIARIQSALALREQAFTESCYRLIYGDSDLLPGVVVDRYGPYLVLQLNNAGIESYEAQLVEALSRVVEPKGILLRADSRNRREQGLQDRLEVVFGEVPDEVPLIENGVHFSAPVHGGQKTGWFYDHRMSRARLAAYVEGKSVLDVFSYIGGWGVQAAAFGASSVCCVDSS
ncbi:class I SAM-dependent rRNA methyltransferase, partial [Marinobacter alexandrii]|uniref:class I SAM-dependent rRNA methyltransferase n=1 Tax=Marinobacter alexandrii TaxID=2570351 RepID=UPI0032970084